MTRNVNHNAVPPVFGERIGAVLGRHLSAPADDEPPVRGTLPLEFRRRIEATISDEKRNGSARKAHKVLR